MFHTLVPKKILRPPDIFAVYREHQNRAVLRVLPVRIAVSNQYQLRFLPLPKSGIHRRIRKYIKLDRDCCPQIQIFH